MLTKTSLHIFQRLWSHRQLYLTTIRFNYNSTTINSQENSRYLKLNNSLLNNSWGKVEIMRKIKKYFELKNEAPHIKICRM